MPGRTPEEQIDSSISRDFHSYTLSNEWILTNTGVNHNEADDQCTDCNLHCDPTNADQFIWYEYDEIGSLYCEHCYAERTFVCRDCQQVCSRRKKYTVNGSMIDPRTGESVNALVCNKCREAYEECRSCSKGFKEEEPEWLNGENGFCRQCVHSILGFEGMMTRSAEDVEKPKLDANTEGTIVRSMRKFGIELEAQYHRNKDIPMAYVRLPREMGIGTDSSIAGKGVELRSPPMAGMVAEDIVATTCKVLKDLKFSVDVSCGFHVHIDTRDLMKVDKKTAFYNVRDLWLFHIAFEDVIMSFLPPSRRGTRYCRALRGTYNFTSIMQAGDMTDLERIWYRMDSLSDIEDAKGQHRHESRYRGINMHTLFRDNHIEIRYHTGTMRAQKILEWVNLHISIIDNIFKNGIDHRWIDLMNGITNTDEKIDHFFGFLKLPAEREAYLRARRTSFRPKSKVEDSQAYKDGLKILREEVEH